MKNDGTHGPLGPHERDDQWLRFSDQEPQTERQWRLNPWLYPWFHPDEENFGTEIDVLENGSN